MAGKRVLVVSHGGTIWCFRYVLERWTYEEAERRFRTESISNCSVTSYRFSGETGRLELGDCARVLWGPASAAVMPTAPAGDSS